MTKNPSDLHKAVTQNSLENMVDLAAREVGATQEPVVKAPNPRAKIAARPDKKTIHELNQPSPDELESDPSAAPIEQAESSGLAKGQSGSANPASDSVSASLDTLTPDALHLAQSESDLSTYSGFRPGHFGSSYLLAQAVTETTPDASDTKAAQGHVEVNSSSSASMSGTWLLPLALLGGGSSKGSTQGNALAPKEPETVPDTPIPLTVTKLRVVGGPVKDAKVYVDLNGDGVISDGEPEVGSTDSTGFANLALTAEQANKPLLAKGGTDTETNKSFAGVLAAPAGSTVINPLTTLVAALMEGGQSLAEAKAGVVTALGLTGVSDLTSYDTFAQASTPEGMANHLKAVQIANIIVAGAALAASDNTAAAQTGAASRVIDALAAKIASTAGSVTFNAAVLTDVLTSAGATSHAASVAAAIESVNTLVANATGPNALAQVAQAQVLAQVTLTNAIQTAATGGLDTVTALQDSTTAAQMASDIELSTPEPEPGGGGGNTDTQAPDAPTLVLSTAVADGATAAEATALTGVVTVKAEDKANVKVTFTNGNSSVTKDLNGTGAIQSVVLTAENLATLGSGAISVSAVATDAAGNASSAAAISFTLSASDPVSIVFAQQVTMDGGTRGGDASIANLQTTAIKYTLTSSVPIQSLDTNDFQVTNGEVTSVNPQASFEFSEGQKLEEVLGNGLMIIRDETLMYGALNLVTPSGQASQAYDEFKAVGELADGTVVLILKTYDQTDWSTVAELKFYDSTGEEIPDYLNIDFTNLNNAEIINGSAIVFKFTDSNDLLVDSKGNSLPLPQSSSYEYWTLPDGGGTLIFHTSFSDARRFASDEPQTTAEGPGIGVVFLDADGELTTTHAYGDHDFEGAVIQDVIRGAIIYSTYDAATSSSSIHLIDQEGTKISNADAGWNYYYSSYGDDDSLIQIYRYWNSELGEPPASDTYSSIVFVSDDGRLVEAGTGSEAYYGGHDFEGATIETLYDNGVITYYLYDELEDVYSGYIIPKDGDPIFIKDFNSFWYGSTKEYSNGSIIFDLSDGTTILANADGKITKLSEYVDESFSLLDAEGGKLEILETTEFSSLTHKSSSNGFNYWEVEITGSDNAVTKATAVTNDLGILTGAAEFQAGTYYTPGLQIGSFELQENQYIYSWLENGTFIVGDYALYDPVLNQDIFLNNGGERVNTFVLIHSSGNVLSEYFTNDNITTAEDNYPDSYSYISGIPEGGMVLKLQVNEPKDNEGDQLTTGWQIVVLDHESKVSLDVYISPEERIYYLKSILPEGLIYSAFNDQSDIIYKLANSEGETLAAFDNYLVSADGHLFLDMNDEVQTWDWETKTATPLTFTPDPLKWMVEVKPNDGVEGNIALSLKADATIVDEDSALLQVSAAPSAPLVPVDTLGPISPTVLLGPDVDGDVTREEAAHENGVVTITAEMGSSVEVTFSKDGSEVFSKTVTGAGSTPVAVVLTADQANTLGYGAVRVSAVATDAAGNAGDAGETTFTMQLPNYAPVFETTGLVAYWKMDEGTGTLVQDSGPNGLDANLMSDAAWANTGAPGFITAKSISLNNDYLQVADNSLFNLSSGFTISAWVKPTDVYNNVIIDRGQYNFLLSIGPNDQPGLGFSNKNDWFYSTTAINVNEWVHVAVSWDSDTRAIKLYKDGVLTDTFSNIQPLDFSVVGDLNIGRQNPSYPYEHEMNGQLDEIAIFDRALGASEISSLMQEGLQTHVVVFPDNGNGIAYQANATDVNQDTVIYGLNGTDADLFNIDASTGAVTFKTTPDYETPVDDDGDNVYNFTITASDAVNTPTALAVHLEVLVPAIAVNINSRTNGDISVDGETDLYSIQLTEGEKYIFTLEASSSSALDAGLTLFGPSPSSNTISLLTNNNAFYLNNNARITYTAQETGTYYIQANGVSKTSGDYVLSVSDSDVPTPKIEFQIPSAVYLSEITGNWTTEISWRSQEFYLYLDTPWTNSENDILPSWANSEAPVKPTLVKVNEPGSVAELSTNIIDWGRPTIQSGTSQNLIPDTNYVYTIAAGAIKVSNGLTNDYYESTIFHTSADIIGPVAMKGGVAIGIHDATYNNLTGFSSLDVATPGQTLSIPTSPEYLFVQFDEPVRWPAGGWNQEWSAAASNGVIDGVYLKEDGVPVYEFGVAYIPARSDYEVGNIHLDLENKTGSDTSNNDEAIWLDLRNGFKSGYDYELGEYIDVPVGFTLKEGATYTLVFDVGMYDPMLNFSEPTTPPFEFSFIVDSQVL